MTPADPALDPSPLAILYTNWRGETARRLVIPIRLWYGSTRWHPERQWLLEAQDCAKGETRDFALAGMRALGEGASPEAERRAIAQAALLAAARALPKSTVLKRLRQSQEITLAMASTQADRIEANGMGLLIELAERARAAVAAPHNATVRTS